MATISQRLATEERSMDMLIGMSPLDLLTSAIPEIDDFDLAAFDTLPIWGSRAARDQPPVILVIDDEPTIGMLVHRVLQDRWPQYDIIVATHPMEALERIRGRMVALIIADFNMPDMNGICLAARIKAHAPHVQVLLITAYPTAILERLARQQNIDYYLPKPFQLSDMERLVVRALGAREIPAATRPCSRG
jgi:CheY-like chemotaxis protein